MIASAKHFWDLQAWNWLQFNLDYANILDPNPNKNSYSAPSIICA